MSVQGPSVGRSYLGFLFNRFVGAVTGRQVDALDGAAIRARFADGVEPSNSALLRDLDRIFGRNYSESGFVPAPADHYSARGMRLPPGRGFNALGQLGAQPGLSNSNLGRSLDHALATVPGFRQELEAIVRGQVLPVGSPSGNLVVLQTPPGTQPQLPRFPSTPSGAAAGQALIRLQAPLDMAMQGNHLPSSPPQMSGVLGGLQQMEANIAKLAQQLGSSGGQPTGTFQDMQGAVVSAAGAMGGGAGGGPMKDQPFAQHMQAQAVGGVQPGVQQAMSDTARQQMLQYMMNNLRKMYELLSNIMKQMHEMQMTAIRNVT